MHLTPIPTGNDVQVNTFTTDAQEQPAAEAGLRERARQRDEADAALRINPAQFQAIMDHAPVLVFVKDLAGRYTFVNRAAKTWAGASITPAVGKTAHDILSKEGAGEVVLADAKVIATKAPLQREMTIETPTGRRTMLSVKFPLLDATNAVSAIGTIATDITDRKHAEAQLSQAQRMEAIGQLTGGVAHDFNNMLTVILLNADVLATQIQNDSLRQLAEAMRRAAEHGAGLTRRLLAFGRRQTLMSLPTDINELLSDMVPLMKRTLGEHIEIKLVLGADLWVATVDRGQLESAALNLAVNARDAMPSGGRLTIETANAELDEDYTASNPDVRTGRYVMIAIADTGSGMAPDVLARAFEPFFTTKDVGKGTGLGLSMIYGFVKQSEGHVRIYSDVGVGTVVRLYLPPSNDAAAPAVNPPVELPTGTETILLEFVVEMVVAAGLLFGIPDAGTVRTDPAALTAEDAEHAVDDSQATEAWEPTAVQKAAMFFGIPDTETDDINDPGHWAQILGFCDALKATGRECGYDDEGDKPDCPVEAKETWKMRCVPRGFIGERLMWYPEWVPSDQPTLYQDSHGYWMKLRLEVSASEMSPSRVRARPALAAPAWGPERILAEIRLRSSPALRSLQGEVGSFVGQVEAHVRTLAAVPAHIIQRVREGR